MEFKNLTKVLKISMVALLLANAGCKKEKTQTKQTDLIQAKWYTKQVITTTKSVSSGATTSSNTNTNFSTSDFVTFDSNSKYSSSGTPLAGDYGAYAVSNSSTLTLTSSKSSNSSSTYSITKLDNSNLTLETSATSGNNKIVVDIVMSK